MSSPPATETSSMPVQLARMEGKLDQVIVDHERRLGESAQTLGVLGDTVRSQGLILATHTAQITSHTKDLTDLEIRSGGALGKVMMVASPIIAAAALVASIVLGSQ